MPVLLRRVGGLKRLLLLAMIAAASIYVFQAFVLNSGARDRLLLKGGHSPVPNLLFGDSSSIGTGQCSVDKICGASELTVNLSGAVHERIRPQACINSLLIFATDKIVRGLNLIVIEGTENQKAVQDIKYFDFATSDREFVAYVTNIPNNRILLISSWGDFTLKLSPEGRELLKLFGSNLVASLTAQQSFVMIGQKGLESGNAIEKVASISSDNPDGLVELRGCVPVPCQLSQVTSLPGQGEAVVQAPVINMPQIVRDVVYGAELAHCGRKDPCLANEVAIFVYSGKDKDDEPKICVHGRFIISRDLNKAGRGLNVVVLNSTAKEILRVGHFDTYQEDSSTLEIFLEDLIPGEMIVVVSFDEASTRLSSMAKQIFYELGSGLIQNLKFRSSWYFIGQKGINGFTPFEELNYASGAEWARPIDKKLCVPRLLDGQKVRPDPTSHIRNDAKRHFCSKYDGYEDFCDEARLDDPLTPAPAFNRTIALDAIFRVPILIVAGLAHNSLRLCLETVIRQSGLNLTNVLVTYDENYPESGALAQLFGIASTSVAASSSYSAQVLKSLEVMWTQFPSADTAIVIEEELLLTSDFMFYMSQMLPVLSSDSSILTISAWNDNGFTATSSVPELAYRVEGFPGLGFMIRRSTYFQHINATAECCSSRAWDGWLKSKKQLFKDHHMIVPDVSRVYRRNAEGLGVLEPHVYDLFRRPRLFNTLSDPIIRDVQSLEQTAYDLMIKGLLSSRQTASVDYTSFVAGKCAPGKPETVLNDRQLLRSTAVAIIFPQKHADDYLQLQPLLQCFGLYHSPKQPPRGLYKGLLRFTYKKMQFLLVGSHSAFNAATKAINEQPKPKESSALDVLQSEMGSSSNVSNVIVAKPSVR